MLLVRGWAGETALTGTIYEEGEQPPSFSGSPDTQASFVWICDEFYEVDSGGSTQVIDGRELQIAFESPMPRGFETKDSALAAAEEHVRTQFARLGVDPESVEVEVIRDVDPDEHGDQRE
jgi:hypothetical protein